MADCETKKPWQSKETILGIIALLLPFLVAFIKNATGTDLSLSAEQVYEVLTIFFGLVIASLVAIRNFWTSGKISLR